MRRLAILSALALGGCYTGVDGGAASGGPQDTAADSGAPSGGDSDSDSNGDGGDDGGNDGGPAPLECDEEIDGALTSMVRLPATAYRNAVEALLGVSPNDVDLPEDQPVEGFVNDANRGEVQLQALQMYMTAAEALADEAILGGGLLPDCGAMAEADCVEAFVVSFGREAYRRPLDADEVSSMVALFSDSRAVNDFPQSVSLVVQAFLQSPAFLYWVPETEAPVAGVARLTDDALAARLALFLWDAVPDDALLAATDAGELRDNAELEAQVRRMLEDGRFESNAARFHTQWLELHEVPFLTRAPEAFPDFDTVLAESMAEEIERSTGTLLANPAATLGDLLTGTETFVNGPLATLYGIEGPASEDTWEPATLDGRRAGILTKAALLAVRSDSDANTSPVLRGHFIRERVLCSPVPPPPTDLDVSLPEADPDLTTRERYDWILEQENCAPCHVNINDFGYPYETFDASGAWRDTEGSGQPIDASGGIVGMGASDTEVVGAVEMAGALAAADEAAQCYAENWYRFAHSHTVDPETDECGIATAVQRFKDADLNLQELIVAVATSEAFRHVLVD